MLITTASIDSAAMAIILHSTRKASHITEDAAKGRILRHDPASVLPVLTRLENCCCDRLKVQGLLIGFNPET